MKKNFILIVLCSFACSLIFAQYTTDKVVWKKQQAVLDSLKTTEYPYLLPIWGKKLRKKDLNFRNQQA